MSGLLAQISADEPIDTISGDAAYDMKQCHKVIGGHDATPSIPTPEGATPWSEHTPEQAGEINRSTTLREWGELNARGEAVITNVR